MKNVLTFSAKKVLVPLGLTAAIAAADKGVPKKESGFGTIALIISNEEMEDIMKIFKSFKYSAILIKENTQTTEITAKEEICKFLRLLLDTLVAGFLGNMLVGK